MDINTTHENHTTNKYNLNNKIMITSILCLSFVILLVFLLHIYARCMLRPPRVNRAWHSTPQPDSIPMKLGLDPTIINLLPSFLFKEMDGHDQVECAICFALLEEDELVRCLPNCNHFFHLDCVDKWLSGQSTCPICRSDAAPRLSLLDREAPVHSELTEVVIVNSQGCEYDHNNLIKNNNNGSGSSSSSSFRLSSFRKIIIGRDRSPSSSRIQVCGEVDFQMQGQAS